MEPDAAQQESQQAAQEEEDEDEADPAVLAKKQKQLAKRGVTFEAKVDPKVNPHPKGIIQMIHMQVPFTIEAGWHMLQRPLFANVTASAELSWRQVCAESQARGTAHCQSSVIFTMSCRAALLCLVSHVCFRNSNNCLCTACQQTHALRTHRPFGLQNVFCRQRRKVVARLAVQARPRLVAPVQGEAGQVVGAGLDEAGANDSVLGPAAAPAVCIAVLDPFEGCSWLL